VRSGTVRSKTRNACSPNSAGCFKTTRSFGRSSRLRNEGIPQEFNDFNKSNVSTLGVYVHDDDTSGVARARACWHDYSGVSASCSSWDTNGAASNTGDDTLSPSVSVWNTTSGAAYVEIEIPEDSYLEGVYMSS
jgi:hypothetical protein